MLWLKKSFNKQIDWFRTHDNDDMRKIYHDKLRINFERLSFQNLCFNIISKKNFFQFSLLQYTYK